MRRTPPILALLSLVTLTSPALAAWSTSPSVNLAVRVAASSTDLQTLRWDGSDESGHAAASGLYFARFDGAGRTIVRRLVIER